MESDHQNDQNDGWESAQSDLTNLRDRLAYFAQRSPWAGAAAAAWALAEEADAQSARLAELCLR